MIIAIPKSDINKHWDNVKHFIEDALIKGYGEMDVDDIHTLLEEGKAILILAIVNNKIIAGIVAVMFTKPLIREMVILTASGSEIDFWLDDIMTVIDNLAKEKQADVIAIHGRKGWVKKLNKYEYKEQYTTVIKRL